MVNSPMCANTVPPPAAFPESEENSAFRKNPGPGLYRPGTPRGQQLDRYGGFLDVKGKQTGFFHTECINDRWWLVTPDGHGFFGIGLSHPITSMSEGAITFAYGGSQEAWMRDGIRKMRELGFNCVWSGPYSLERISSGNIDTDLADRIYREAEIPYAIHVPLIKHQVELKPGEKRPDVFSPKYRRFVGEEVARRVALHWDNPWLLGYYYGYGSFMREDLWLNETLSHEPGSPGREQLFDVLEQRYGSDIAQLNTVYGTSFASFPDLRRHGSLTYPRWISAVKAGTPLPAQAGSKDILADAEALLGEIVERLHKIAHAEIRRHDSNHMVLGAYVKHTTYTQGIWKRIAPYIDVLGPQDVSDVNPIKPSVEATGVPALLSDQEFGNVYPLALQGRMGTPGAVPDHVDRRVLYDLLVGRIAPDPDFIGVSFCAVLHDQSHWRQAYDRGQPGFYNIDGEPNRNLVATVRSANRRILASVRRPLDATSLAELHDSYNKTKAAYRRVMEQRFAFLRIRTHRHGSQSTSGPRPCRRCRDGQGQDHPSPIRRLLHPGPARRSLVADDTRRAVLLFARTQPHRPGQPALSREHPHLARQVRRQHRTLDSGVRGAQPQEVGVQHRRLGAGSDGAPVAALAFVHE